MKKTNKIHFFIRFLKERNNYNDWRELADKKYILKLIENFESDMCADIKPNYYNYYQFIYWDMVNHKWNRLAIKLEEAFKKY